MSVTRAKRNAARTGVRAQPEWALQVQICDYLRRAYPNVRFLSDVKAAVKLTIPQSVRLKKVQADDFACPDLMIFAARHGKHALFMELKASSPFKQDGTLRTDEHLSRQMAALKALVAEGYWASFVWDFDTARASIDWYLG
jgi:hypothetical protein